MIRLNTFRRYVPTRPEMWRVVRFLVVGAAVALTYSGLFLGLRAMGFTLWQANGVAHFASISVQYIAHTLWTFRSDLRDRSQQGRFLGVIAFGFAFSFLVTTVLSPTFGWSDQVSAALVVFVLPVFNYILYRIWVFRVRS